MPLEVLEKYYGIKPERSYPDGKFVRHVNNNSLYTIMNVTKLQQPVLLEIYEMAEQMGKLGDQRVGAFFPSQHKTYLITHKEQDYVVIHNHVIPYSRQKNQGRRIAIFHERGRHVQANINELNRLNQWKLYWIQRLEQMENMWSNLVRSPTDEKFEKLFVQSFPYYLGICENAIQYVTDTELDEQPFYNDGGTICHQRFHEGLWQGEFEVRNPFDWVVDYAARDIAEWIRDHYFRQQRSFQPKLLEFLEGYEAVTPLSNFSWRMIYARLLFPLHYFTVVEDYYLTSSESVRLQLEDQLETIIRTSREYEMFLAHFYQIAGVKGLPEVDWLQSSSKSI